MAGTLRDLINGAARSINIVRQNAVLTGENMTVALYALSNFVATCSNNKLLIFNYETFVFPLSSKKEYTLGVGGDWNIPRPMDIETAYVRLNNGTQQELDISLAQLTFSQYAGISVKNTPGSFPFAYYDNGDYPLRKVTVFPVPTQPCDIVLWLRSPLLDLQLQAIASLGPITPGSLYTDGFYPNVRLGGGSGSGAQANITVLGGKVTDCVLTSVGTNYTVGDTLTVSPVTVGGTGSGFSIKVLTVSSNLDDPIEFPPGYLRFFRLGLAIELAPEFGKTPSELIMHNFADAKLQIEAMNTVPVFVRGDGSMSRGGRKRFFNWITGNFWSFGNN